DVEHGGDRRAWCLALVPIAASRAPRAIAATAPAIAAAASVAIIATATWIASSASPKAAPVPRAATRLATTLPTTPAVQLELLPRAPDTGNRAGSESASVPFGSVVVQAVFSEDETPAPDVWVHVWAAGLPDPTEGLFGAVTGPDGTARF